VEEIKSEGAGAARERQVQLDFSSAETGYANFSVVTTGPEEFVLSFGMRLGEEQGQSVPVANRIVMSPKNFKRTVAALSRSLQMYEQRFGEIDASPPQAPQGQGEGQA